MSEGSVHQALAGVGRHLRYPPTPDLATAVRARLERPVPAVRPRVRRMALVATVLVTLLVAGLAAFSPAVRAALLRIFVLPGIRIEVTDTAPPTPEGPLGHGLRLGRSVSLEEAEAAVGFPVRIPDDPGPPTEVYLAELGTETAVTMVWPAGPELPEASSTRVGLLLTQFRATPDEQYLKKLVEAEVPVLFPQVDGHPGYWLPGPHALLVVDEHGRAVEDSARVAGNTLLWSEGGVTYRLESALELGPALRVAESLR